LPEFANEIAKHNIDHVTITINCVDPEIGAKIYPWIYWNNRRIRGVEAARILIEQQQKGLEMLTAKGVLVKVNSVMIPGVNDTHLKEVSKIVKAKGAFLHNVMPLIAEAEHGTYYGIMEQPGPTAAELQSLQDACAGDMAMMRHCRQCRADAVGMLGEDRGAEFSLDKIDALEIDYASAMTRRKVVHEEIIGKLEAQRNRVTTTPKKVGTGGTAVASGRPVLMAVATTGGGVINQHFGHAREFLIYEASDMDVRFIGHRKTDLYCSGGNSCGEEESVLDKTIAALTGCEVVLCAKIGYEPWGALEAAGIQPNGEHAMEPIEDAVAAVWCEMLAAGKLVAPAALRKCA
jgi:nitrogen fixation protein NifB